MVSQRPDKPPPKARFGKQVTSTIRRPGPRPQIPVTTPEAGPAHIEYPRPTLPRLSFSGRFYTDPSTVNNDVHHYDIEKFRPSFQLRQDSTGLHGWWHPEGMASFALVNCRVIDTYSPSCGGSPPHGDSLLGQSIEYNRRSVYGKISDLDPQMQTVSALYGVNINIGDSSSSDAFTSLLLPTSFRELWRGIDIPGQGSLSAVYQGFLSLGSFEQKDSAFLRECKEYICDEEGNLLPDRGLSVRFRVDTYNTDFNSEDFCYGNVTGFITPWIHDWPKTFDISRRLFLHLPTGNSPSADDLNATLCNTAYAAVEKTRDGSLTLCLDLANSLFRSQPTGTLTQTTDTETYNTWTTPYKDQGRLEIGYLTHPSDPAEPVVPTSFVAIGEIQYKTKAFEDASCVVNVPLTKSQFDAIQSAQLCLRATSVVGDLVYYLAEAEDGIFTRADRFVYHLQGNKEFPEADAETAQIFCSKFGVPQKDQKIVVGFDYGKMRPDMLGMPPQIGEPVSAIRINREIPKEGSNPLDFSLTVTTNEKGYAPLALTGGDCKNPRGYIDGQMYFLRYAAGTVLPEPQITKDNPTPDCERINILMFNAFEGEKDKDLGPSWLVDIQPIFQVYANLYPAMHRIVRLDDYGSVVSRRHALLRVFDVEEDDPLYMPTTRDLSKAKRDMIVNWLNSPHLPFMNTTKDDLKAAMQTVIELEHATMPPYLTALFSIKQGYNQYISETLREIAYEEMLHMALACNILTAIGGKPNINKMGFVPKFPGPLPSGLRSGLIVRLRKCSIDQIKSFVSIEAPEEQHLLVDGTSSEFTPTRKNEYTIGWLYDKIEKALEDLDEATHPELAGKGIQFPDNPDLDPEEKERRLSLQLDIGFHGKLFKIKNLKDAKKAIKQIKDEGEGTPGCNDPFEHPLACNNEDETGQPPLAHYFLFRQIVEGHQLVMNRFTRSYKYNGPRIELNMDGVYNMQDDPKIEEQPVGSKQRERMESFARKYQTLLNGLEITFTKDPAHIKQCFSLMFQLTISAQELMQMPALNEDGTPKADGTTCGVSFQVPLHDADI